MIEVMKAVVSARYGPPDVLEIQKVPKPTAQCHIVVINSFKSVR